MLAHDRVEIAVTETARGGILLKGIGVTRNDVSVVTNVSADHLGLQGIDTVDQLAEVKSVVPRITRSDGWAVLNADDPRVLAMRGVVKAQPWVFSRDPDSPALRDVVGDGGRATTVIDGWVCVLDPRQRPRAARGARRRPDDPVRALPLQRRERPRRGLRHPRPRHPARRSWSRGCARSGPTPSTTPAA